MQSSTCIRAVAGFREACSFRPCLLVAHAPKQVRPQIVVQALSVPLAHSPEMQLRKPAEYEGKLHVLNVEGVYMFDIATRLFIDNRLNCSFVLVVLITS